MAQVSKGWGGWLWLKHMRAHLSRSTIFGAAMVLMLLGLPSLSSVPTGVGELGNDGCTCHGGDSDDVSVELIGLPEFYQSNATYNLSIVISGPEQSDQERHQGGFRMIASQGTIIFENSSQVKELEAGWTHEFEGTYQRVWNLTWTAHTSSLDPVQFIVHGNAVNGNEQSSGDEWNSFGAAIAHIDSPTQPEQPVFDRDIGLIDWTVFTFGLSALFFFLVRVAR